MEEKDKVTKEKENSGRELKEKTEKEQAVQDTEQNDDTQTEDKTIKPTGNPEADAQSKLNDLLFCGNDRVELSAAKEILSMAEKKTESVNDIKLDVRIKIV